MRLVVIDNQGTIHDVLSKIEDYDLTREVAKTIVAQRVSAAVLQAE